MKPVIRLRSPDRCGNCFALERDYAEVFAANYRLMRWLKDNGVKVPRTVDLEKLYRTKGIRWIWEKRQR